MHARTIRWHARTARTASHLTPSARMHGRPHALLHARAHHQLARTHRAHSVTLHPRHACTGACTHCTHTCAHSQPPTGAPVAALVHYCPAGRPACSRQPSLRLSQGAAMAAPSLPACVRRLQGGRSIGALRLPEPSERPAQPSYSDRSADVYIQAMHTQYGPRGLGQQSSSSRHQPYPAPPPRSPPEGSGTTPLAQHAPSSRLPPPGGRRPTHLHSNCTASTPVATHTASGAACRYLPCTRTFSGATASSGRTASLRGTCVNATNGPATRWQRPARRRNPTLHRPSTAQSTWRCSPPDGRKATRLCFSRSCRA